MGSERSVWQVWGLVKGNGMVVYGRPGAGVEREICDGFIMDELKVMP